MSLSLKEANKLKELGFRRHEYNDKVYPTDIFEYNGETWSVGGRIVPNGNLICNEDIYINGVWLPNIDDLLSWLENNDCTYNLSYNGLGYKIVIVDRNNKVFKGKGGTLEFSIFNALIKILKEYGGNIVNKTYNVLEAERISEE
ncbi:hypothetical protein [Clostridium beijerinckii]|uniref:hypothetical protein n=1 Tax=Clostridium beijerinckii TaxID=1520 RepID=UPI0014942792|nr:hypothetical protein [Clostridium beijerinckii]NOW06141.1 hypothetical protein [Clostridium beijerinckii]